MRFTGSDKACKALNRVCQARSKHSVHVVVVIIITSGQTVQNTFSFSEIDLLSL